MSTYVVDSSIVASWLIEDEKTPESEQLYNQFRNEEIDLIAPLLLQTEVANLLRTNVLRGRITKEKASKSLTEFLELPISYMESDLETVLQTAFKYDLTVYDSCYLSLALAGYHLLLTNDQQLANAYSSSANTVSEPTMKYYTGKVSQKKKKRQLEKYYQIQFALLTKKLKAENEANEIYSF